MGRYPATPACLDALRRDVRAFAHDVGANGRSDAAAQAASEAAANAIVHGHHGGDPAASIEVAAERDGDMLRVSVADRGQGFRPRRHSPGLGLGLALIAQLADDVQLRERESGGVEVTMRFRVA